MREALKLALEALERYQIKRQDFERFADVITAIKEALAQDELCSPQEPVAVYGYCPECGAKGLQRERRPDGFDRCVNGHIYPSSKATPPKRPWVGLADDEIDVEHDKRFPPTIIPSERAKVREFARAIEATLKEKNT